MLRQTADVLQLSKTYNLDCISDVTIEQEKKKSPGQNISWKREMSSMFSNQL